MNLYGLCSEWEFVAKFVICYSVFTQHDLRRCLCFYVIILVKIDEVVQ